MCTTRNQLIPMSVNVLVYHVAVIQKIFENLKVWVLRRPQCRCGMCFVMVFNVFLVMQGKFQSNILTLNEIKPMNHHCLHVFFCL